MVVVVLDEFVDALCVPMAYVEMVCQDGVSDVVTCIDVVGLV